MGTIDNYLIIHTIAIPSAAHKDVGVRMAGSQFIFEELVGKAEICFPPVHPATSQSRTMFGFDDPGVMMWRSAGSGDVACALARNEVSAYHVLS